jgi:hypothetical protein
LKKAQSRDEKAKDDDYVSEDEVLDALGITKEELNSIDVEIE